jgi:GNAT superfamily N-acetyltransferase
MRAREFVVEYKTEEYNGLRFTTDVKNGQLIVRALDDWGTNELGHVVFNIGDQDELDPQDLEVDDRYQGQGIAKTMYDYVKTLGYEIHRSWDQTPAGAGFWNKHRGADQRVWEDAQPTTAYHITTVENAENILYGGLDPHEGNAYLVVDTGDRKKLRDDLSTVAGWMYAKTEQTQEPLTLLQVNITGLPLKYEHGWYVSKQSIDPARIRDLGEDELARYA